MKLSGLVLSTALLLLAGCASAPMRDNAEARGFQETGEASFYADKYQGRKTANGEAFDQAKATAAHKRLPFGSKVKVTNLSNNKSIVVRINDRGPFVRGRIIDLSRSAFAKIGDTKLGVIEVEIKVLD